MNEHNKKLKSTLNETLSEKKVEINGTKVALLGKQTQQIILECNDGKVSDVRPVFRSG